MSESDLIKSCLDYLKIKRIFHYRQNTGAFKTETGGFYRFGAVGSPDIVVVINGRFVAIECKTKSKQSNNQKLFQTDLELAGGLYWLIYSSDELVDKLEELKNL